MSRSVLHFVGTTHSAIGKCTADALLGILVDISPDIIFEEIPISIHSDLYDHRKYPDSLEVEATRRYLHMNKVPHVPVDLPNLNETAEKHGLNAIEAQIYSLFEKGADSENDADVKEALSVQAQINDITERAGFRGINREMHDRLILRKRQTISEYVANHSDRSLLSKLHLLVGFHFQYREWYILQQVFERCRDYRKSVLLIGADHRPTIIEKVSKPVSKHDIEIITDLDG